MAMNQSTYFIDSVMEKYVNKEKVKKITFRFFGENF